MNRASELHAGRDRIDRLMFGLEHEGERPASALTHNDDDAALASLVLREATVAAVFLVVSGFDVAAEVSAINLDLALNGHFGMFGRKGFAELVGQNEAGFILHVEIARELKGAMPFRAVGEDRDSQQDGADRQLAAGEDRA